VESRFPLAPSVTGHLRASLAASQLTARRKLIKKVETLELEAIDRALQRARGPRHLLHRDRHWRTALRNHVIGRAADVQRSLQHAGGVYFPNRAHAARVTIKQLRYAVELAAATGAWQVPSDLKALRRAQESLGDAHDYEVLLARVDDLLVAGVELNPREVTGLQQYLRGAAVARHARFLATRAGVAEICAACRAWPLSDRRRRGALLAAGLAVPTLLLLHRR
jgi:CHAD domain-containing protein